jgi:hypothetical protein
LTSGVQRKAFEIKQRYAGWPLGPEEGYREAFLSGIFETTRREARQEYSGDARETALTRDVESAECNKREVCEGVSSKEDGRAGTSGVKTEGNLRRRYKHANQTAPTHEMACDIKVRPSKFILPADRRGGLCRVHPGFGIKLEQDERRQSLRPYRTVE